MLAAIAYLREIREQREIKQVQVAKWIGMSNRQYSRWETGAVIRRRFGDETKTSGCGDMPRRSFECAETLTRYASRNDRRMPC